MGFMTIMGFFFLFLLKWGRFKKNYKYGQVVLTWHDFICRSRAKLARLCHVSLKSCQVDTTSAMSTPEVVSTWHDLPHICNFFDNDPILVKTKKKDPMMVIKPISMIQKV